MRYRLGLLILVAVAILFVGKLTAPDLSREVIQALAAEIVTDLPQDDIHLRTLAIAEIEGIQGDELRTELLNQISSETDFVLLERAQIDRLLAEQSFQTGDLVDPQARVRFGEMLGAEGIIFGSVNSFEESWLGQWGMTVQISLDDVQRGEVVFARSFSKQQFSSWNRWFAGAAGAIVLLSLMGTFLRRRKTQSRHDRLDAASEKRVDAVAEIKQARHLLSDVQSKAHEKGEEQVQILRDLRSRLADLQQLIEVSASGDPELHSRTRDKQIHREDKGVAKAAVAIRQRCEKFARMGKTPDEGTLGSLMDDLRAAEAACRGRRVR